MGKKSPCVFCIWLCLFVCKREDLHNYETTPLLIKIRTGNEASHKDVQTGA